MYTVYSILTLRNKKKDEIHIENNGYACIAQRSTCGRSARVINIRMSSFHTETQGTASYI